jgi:hypothetical protein
MAKEDEEEKPRKRGQMRLIWCKQRALAETVLPRPSITSLSWRFEVIYHPNFQSHGRIILNCEKEMSDRCRDHKRFVKVEKKQNRALSWFYSLLDFACLDLLSTIIHTLDFALCLTSRPRPDDLLSDFLSALFHTLRLHTDQGC